MRAARGFDVNALVCIDPHFGDRAILNFAQVDFIVYDKMGAPERVVHPGSAELLDVHADAEIRDRYALSHEADSICADGEHTHFRGRAREISAKEGQVSPGISGDERAWGDYFSMRVIFEPSSVRLYIRPLLE